MIMKQKEKMKDFKRRGRRKTKENLPSLTKIRRIKMEEYNMALISIFLKKLLYFNLYLFIV